MSSLDLSAEDHTQTESSLFAPDPAGVLRLQRLFTTEGVHPFDEVEWEERHASITAENGEVIFEANDVEMPTSWSQMATNVVVSKYFKVSLGQTSREKSLRSLITRVVETITKWGEEGGYFRAASEARLFADELTHLVLHQKAAFNSPVWFNVGTEIEPQCSACFINNVEDTMESILGLARTEGMLFKFGSGTGTNFSALRSSRERLSNGGYASGPVSFMRGYDAFAGVIKSGGRTRRAAKMVILNADHPDIHEFINCKAHEEKKAWALIDAGYDGSFGGEAYSSVMFQNSNNSVRVTDDFMDAVIRDKDWNTRTRTGEVMDTFKARDLMHDIATATHLCGDPGMQFDTIINEWHTCANSGRINASNPCSEYMFLDDSACNLASLNLMLFRKANGDFDVPSFRHAVQIMIIAQEIIIDRAAYPTPQISNNSKRYRPLGLGYANLGAMLMAYGLPYDSDEGRAVAAAVTAIMTGQSYKTSAEIASRVGTFSEYTKNREPFLRVINKHRTQVDRIERLRSVRDLIKAARTTWDEAMKLGEQYGYRNAQVTVLAPTGTIGFMMDCDTTGVEPDIALVKYKKLVGGGMLKLVNQTVPEALKNLNYTEAQISEILQYIETHGTIEGAPGLHDEHLPVFDCAFKPANGLRAIHYMGHLRMMSAVQPFISGAISKTVNMPPEATVDDIAEVYMEAWRLRIKAVAVYRDGCKRTQPLNTKLDGAGSASVAKADVKVEFKPMRRRLPDERRAVTHKFSVGGHEGYLTVGLYEDGMPGEIFVKMSKQGSVVSGLMDSFATAISMALQYCVPLQVLVDKFSHTRFEPSGWTTNKEIPMAKSLMDYIFRWMAIKFLPKEVTAQYVTSTAIVTEDVATPAPTIEDEVAALVRQADDSKLTFDNQSDAPPCPTCGEMMVRNGSCYKCHNCGGTSGCS
ncbi:MAG TPA: vitamin B12-dependent ribonucleotide reductase [Armatimonadota bacterium]|jgi:ribonucleoside-diphosphate reductase alpha chain